MEKWLLNKMPQKGDIVRVRRKRGYCHFGIACSSKEIIHYTGLQGDDISNPDNIKIRKTTLKMFERGDRVEILDGWYSPYNAKEVVKRAESFLESAQFRGKYYNFFTNNCEHFARYCYYGESESVQVENGAAAASVLAGALVTATVLTVKNTIKKARKKKNT